MIDPDVFKNIEIAVQKKLESISGKPKIQYENDVEYKPKIPTRYWRLTHFPSSSTVITADKMIEHSGFFQVDIFVPATATSNGQMQIMNDLGKIIQTFNIPFVYQDATRVDFEEISRGRMQTIDAWTGCNIDIYYKCRSK